MAKKRSLELLRNEAKAQSSDDKSREVDAAKTEL